MPVLYRRGLMESTRVTMISPDYISPNPDQPRRYFDPDGLTELAESIRNRFPVWSWRSLGRAPVCSP